MSRPIPTLILLAILAASAPLHALQPGDPLTPDALGKENWIQGDALDQWEPGALYMIHTWSLQAAPSLAVIPRLNDQYTRLREKGLRVIGVNVRDPDKNAVEAFVRDKGDGMAYPVVFTGPQSAFARQWLEAAKATRIPAIFILRDGTLRLISREGIFDDESLTAMLEEGEGGIRKAAASLEDRASRRAELSRLSKTFNEALEKNDLPTMEQTLAAMRAISPNYPPLQAFDFDVAIAKKDWETAEKLLTGPQRPLFTVNRAARYAASGEDLPDNLLQTITAKYAELMANGQSGGPNEYVTLSRLHFRVGNQDDATTAAKLALQKVSDGPFLALGVPVLPFAKFAAEVEAGRMPTIDEFNAWMREEMAKRRPAPQAPGE